jgi:hypothetical protein
LLVRGRDAEVLDGDPGGTIALLADAEQTDGALKRQSQHLSRRL